MEKKENVEAEIEKLESVLDKLKSDKKVMLYTATQHKLRSLKLTQKVLEDDEYRDKLRYCKHICCPSTDKRYPGNKFEHCVACGLDSKIAKRDYSGLDRKERIMFDVVKEGYWVSQYIRFYPMCDYELAKAVYDRIIEKYPDIDTITMIKYMGIAVENMKEIPVSEERQKSRVKRLNLNPDYDLNAALNADN